MGIVFGTVLPVLVVCLDCISHEAVGGAHGKYLLCFCLFSLVGMKNVSFPVFKSFPFMTLFYSLFSTKM